MADEPITLDDVQSYALSTSSGLATTAGAFFAQDLSFFGSELERKSQFIEMLIADADSKAAALDLFNQADSIPNSDPLQNWRH